jgi:hypothetical protein
MTVPKTPVYEESRVTFGEHDVRRPREVASVKSEAKSQGMSGLSHANFRGRILSPHPRH